MKTRSICALKYRIIIVAYEHVTKLAKSASGNSTAAGSTQFKMGVNLPAILQVGKTKLCTPGLYCFQHHSQMV